MAASDMVHANLKGLIVGRCKPTRTHIHTHSLAVWDADIHRLLVFNRTTQCIKHGARKGIISEPHIHAHTHISGHVGQYPGMHKTWQETADAGSVRVIGRTSANGQKAYGNDPDNERWPQGVESYRGREREGQV